MKMPLRHIIAGVILALAAFPGYAFANGMPMAAFPAHPGGVLSPEAATPVAVLREELTLDLREPDGRITAVYHMENRSDSQVEVTVAFPIPGYDETAYGRTRFSAQLDDRPLASAVLPADISVPAPDRAVSEQWWDPYTGEAYSPKLMRSTPPKFYTFTLPFAARQQRTLQVEYRDGGGHEHTRFVAASRRWDYLLLPARHWDAFEGIQIDVLAPPGRAIWTNLPLPRTGKDTYGATFGALPGQNLSVIVAPGGGPPGVLSSWWWRRGSRGLILMLAVASGNGAAGWLLLSHKLNRRTIGLLLRWGILVAALRLTPLTLIKDSSEGAIETLIFFMPAMVAVWFGAGRIARWITSKHA